MFPFEGNEPILVNVGADVGGERPTFIERCRTRSPTRVACADSNDDCYVQSNAAVRL